MLKNRLLWILFVAVSAGTSAFGQGTNFTGTAVIYGSGFNTRTVTRTFDLRVDRQSSAADMRDFIRVLDRDGQDSLLRSLDDNDLGRFSFTGNIGQRLTAVWVDEVEDGMRLRALFPRWIGFGELRRGYRSTDYPFGYVEIIVDRRTGRGEGTIFPAARIRFKDGKSGAAGTVEIEDFATFPGRLLGVRMRGRSMM